MNKYCIGWFRAVCRLSAWFGMAMALALVFCGMNTRLLGGVDFPWSTQPPMDFTVVTQKLERVMTEADVEGAGLIVLCRGEKLFEHYVGTYGPETVVPIASSTKWLSALVIMSLVDEGKLKLSDPVSKYLPAFTGMKAGMTIAQLFAHTSGLPGDENAFVLSNPLITLAEAANRIATTNLVAPPGTQFAYGGLSMHVGGRVAEVAGGQSWSNLFEMRVKKPLGLQQTTYGATANPRISGGAQSCGREYAAVLAMLLNDGKWAGQQILSASSVREMQKDQRGTTVIVDSPTMAYGEPYASWSYGVGEWREVLDTNGVARVVSSPGAFGFYPWIDLDRQIAGVLVVQTLLRKSFQPVQELRQALYSVLEQGVPSLLLSVAGPEELLLHVTGNGQSGVRLEWGYPLGRWDSQVDLTNGLGPWDMRIPFLPTPAPTGRFFRVTPIHP